MKQILYALMIITFFLSSCGKEKEFDANLQLAYEKMNSTFYESDEVCVDIANTWRTAIFDNKTPSGKYCDDFNDALKELFESLEFSAKILRIEKNKEDLLDLTSKLNDPPSSRKNCYDDFVEIVGEVSSYTRMATDPRGSLQSYGNSIRSTQESVIKKIDQFKIKYSEYLKAK